MPDPTYDSALTASHPLADRDAEWPVVPGCRIEKELGRGGMGVVYQAVQERLNRRVALKVIRAQEFASPRDVLRFRFEAEAAASLAHPGIVAIHEVGEHAGLVWYVMQLVEGETLADLLRRGPLAPDGAARLVARLARAVHHAHERGILHRDIKPANVLLDADGLPHLADLGLARRLDGVGDLTQSGALVGTPRYMAPEQAGGAGGLTTAADVWSLGVILYECLTGRVPFAGATLPDLLDNIRHAAVSGPRELAPSVPADLEAVCLTALEKDPAARYASALHLAEDIERCLAGEPISRQSGLLARVASALSYTPSVASLATEGALWWGVLLNVVGGGAVAVLLWAGGPVAGLWLVTGAFGAASLAVMVCYHGRLQLALLTARERFSVAAHLGETFATFFLLAAVTPPDPWADAAPVSAIYFPAMAILRGLVAFVHGQSHGGWGYINGLVLMAMSVPCRLFPFAAPLLVGGSSAAMFAFTAVVIRAQVEAARAREPCH